MIYKVFCIAGGAGCLTVLAELGSDHQAISNKKIDINRHFSYPRKIERVTEFLFYGSRVQVLQPKWCILKLLTYEGNMNCQRCLEANNILCGS